MLLVGCLSTIGFIFNSPMIKGIGVSTVASPLPFVFSAYNEIETFSTTYEFVIETYDDSFVLEMDNKLYNNLKGPYNRKNVIGASLSHGPFFNKTNLIQIRDQILYWGICKENLIAEFGVPLYEPIKKAMINIRSKTKGNENKKWSLEVVC